MWDVLTHNHLYKNNVVVPPKKRNHKVEKYEGAYVKEPMCRADIRVGVLFRFKLALSTFDYAV